MQVFKMVLEMNNGTLSIKSACRALFPAESSSLSNSTTTLKSAQLMLAESSLSNGLQAAKYSSMT